jgi:hypothetical protein
VQQAIAFMRFGPGAVPRTVCPVVQVLRPNLLSGTSLIRVQNGFVVHDLLSVTVIELDGETFDLILPSRAKFG